MTTDTRDRCICTTCGEEVPRNQPCVECGATDPEAMEIACPKCKGTGDVLCRLHDTPWAPVALRECQTCLSNRTVDAPYWREAEAFAKEWRLAEEHMEARANPECRSCGYLLRVQTPTCLGQNPEFVPADAPLCPFCLVSARALEEGDRMLFPTSIHGFYPHYKALSPFAVAAYGSIYPVKERQ